MGQIIALDSMIFIYLFEADERFYEKTQSIFDQIESGEISAVTSEMSVIEVLSPEKYIKSDELRGEITRFFQESDGLGVLPVNREIALIAASLRRENKSLRTPDAIQLATAAVSGAGLFITNDRKLQKVKVGSMKIRILGARVVEKM